MFYVFNITTTDRRVECDCKWCFQFCILKALITDDVKDGPLGGVCITPIGVSDNVTNQFLKLVNLISHIISHIF